MRPPPPEDLLLSSFHFFGGLRSHLEVFPPPPVRILSTPGCSSATVSICPTFKEVHLDVGHSSLNFGHSEVNANIAPRSSSWDKYWYLGVCHNFEAKLRWLRWFNKGRFLWIYLEQNKYSWSISDSRHGCFEGKVFTATTLFHWSDAVPFTSDVTKYIDMTNDKGLVWRMTFLTVPETADHESCNCGGRGARLRLAYASWQHPDTRSLTLLRCLAILGTSKLDALSTPIFL